MEYNNYYPAQSGHPPPPLTNQQHGGPQMQHPPPNSGQLMHAPMPPQNIRQAMPPGPPSHHQQMQHQHPQPHLGHHPQQMPPQQQHPNYHQIQPPHPHGPPVSHSGSPHPQQQQQHLNHQPTLSGPPPPQQSAISSQQHHMHPQSPHHHAGPPMHMQQQQQQQQPPPPPPQLNQMVRPPMGPSVMNHPQPSLQQPPHHHQNFFSGGPIPQSNLHHYPQQNQHHPHHPHHPHHQHQQQHHHHPQIMHHHAPPLASHHHPHLQQAIGRNSPYYPSILQTEFRIIELNRRLQCRPIPTKPANPLPTNTNYDESLWWERFASEFFEDDATLTLRIHEDKPVEFTIGRTLIPRFFRKYFDGGVTDLSINLRNPKEAYIHPQLITLECDQAFILTNIFECPGMPRNVGLVVHTEGHLILDFVSNNYDTLSIKSWKFYTRGCREYIDRSITTLVRPDNNHLAEPVYKQGISKSSIFYLKLCMVMEPMQEIMHLHRVTKLDPKSCLRKYLLDKYKYRSGDDNRVATNKRRKRKPSAAPAITGATTTKKSKANVNNSICNNSGLNNNIIMSPSGAPSFSLASQDVMVVGEPSMMGGDFGDDNERVITRMENTQYDPTASTPSNAEESDSMNTFTVTDNGLSGSNNNNVNNLDMNMENHTLPPSLLQHRQQQQQVPPPMQVLAQQTQIDQSSPIGMDHQQQRLQLNIQDQVTKEEPASDQTNQVSLIEHTEIQQHEDVGQIAQTPVPDQAQMEPEQVDEEVMRENVKLEQVSDEQQTKANSLGDNNDSNLMLGLNSVEQIANHTNSIQPLNEESNSNSQLPCSTASATSAMEQQQPVDNGVA